MASVLGLFPVDPLDPLGTGRSPVPGEAKRQMHSRWFNTVVVLLWLSTMTWLVTKKILPALLVGDPPKYTAILEHQQDKPPVGWRMSWDDQAVGWAVTTTKLSEDSTAEVRNRLEIERFPLAEVIPTVLQTLLSPDEPLPAHLSMTANSRLVFDEKGRLSLFDAAVQLENGFDAITISGTIDGAYLTISLAYAGGTPYETDMLLPRKAMLANSFSPEACLPGLREGQSWTVELFSPLHSPNDPVEILQAKVEGSQPMLWNDRTVNTWLVVYRDDPATRSGDGGRIRGRLWVLGDGTVLKQEAAILSSTLSFVRLPDEEAARLAERLIVDPRVGFGEKNGEVPAALQPTPAGDVPSP